MQEQVIRPLENKREYIHRLVINEPLLPKDSTLEHKGTKFQISRSTNFENPANLIVSSAVYKQDNQNIVRIDNLINVAPNEVVYSRYAYIIGEKTSQDKQTYQVQDWSRISSNFGDQSGFKFDDNIISTPQVYVKEATTQAGVPKTIIEARGYKVLTGLKGKHKYTTWEISDTDNKTIFFRTLDEDNLNSIAIDDRLLEKNKLYFVRAKFVNEANSESNYGCLPFNKHIYANRSYSVEPVYPFQFQRDLTFRLKIMTPDAAKIRFIIKEVIGDQELQNSEAGLNNVYTINGNTIRISFNSIANAQVGKVYRIYTALVLNGDKELPLVFLDQFTLENSSVYGSRPDTQYSKKGLQNSISLLDIGPTVVNTRELMDGSFILGVNTEATPTSGGEHSSFLLFGKYGNVIRNTGIKVPLPSNCPKPALGTVGIPYVNVLPLYNNWVLINYAALNEDLAGTQPPGEQYETIYKKSVWVLYDYDPSTYGFTCLGWKIQDDEILSTSVSSSAVVRRIKPGEKGSATEIINSEVYYVPHAIGTYATVDPNVPVTGPGDHLVSNITYKELEVRKITFSITGGPNNKPTSVALNIETVRGNGLNPIATNIKKFVTLVPFGDHSGYEGRFALIGGTEETEYPCEDSQNVPVVTGRVYYKLSRQDVTELKITSATKGGPATGYESVTLGQLPDEMKQFDLGNYDTGGRNYQSCYNLCGQLRADGKIVLFNNSLTTRKSRGVGEEATGLNTSTNTWLLEISNAPAGGYTVTVTDQNNDTNIDVPFCTTIAKTNGDFLRVSYFPCIRQVAKNQDGKVVEGIVETDKTPIVLGYSSELQEESDNSVGVVNNELVVERYQRVAISNPYLYKSITINGTSEEDTGILTWYDGTRVRNFTCFDRIITRDTEEEEAVANAKAKERLYVLDDVKYTIKK